MDGVEHVIILIRSLSIISEKNVINYQIPQQP